MPKIVAQCRNYSIPYLYTLDRTIPYLNILDRTIPYLNTLDRTIPYVNTLRKNPKPISCRQPIRIESAETLSHILIQYRNIPYLITLPEDPSRLSAAIAYLNTWGPPAPHLISSHFYYSNAFSFVNRFEQNTIKSIIRSLFFTSELTSVVVNFWSNRNRKLSVFLPFMFF